MCTGWTLIDKRTEAIPRCEIKPLPVGQRLNSRCVMVQKLGSFPISLLSTVDVPFPVPEPWVNYGMVKSPGQSSNFVVAAF